MRAKLLDFIESLQTSFWFVPAVMAVTAALLSFVMISVDERQGTEVLLEDYRWLYIGGMEGAREFLGTIAGSMITVAGVVFSITVMVLSQASSQFGPRLLRNFMRDRGTQVVLGTFVATFLYCLLVLRTIREIGDNAFVPHLSAAVGLLLAVASLCVLIYFIHHIAAMIQAPNVVASVAHDLMGTIDRLFPDDIGHPAREVPSRDGRLPERFEEEARRVEAMDDDYVQAIDEDRVMQIAAEHDLILRLHYQPGSFVVRGRPLLLAWPAERVDEHLADRLREVFVLGPDRTERQDLRFAIDQLVEIAVRALSPSLNDPFTAMTCLDRLGAALARLARRRMPDPRRHDDGGRLRVVADTITFERALEAAFDPIRPHGRTSALVATRLLETIAEVARHTGDEEHRAALRRQADLVEQESRQALESERERRQVNTCYREALRAVGGPTTERASADGP